MAIAPLWPGLGQRPGALLPGVRRAARPPFTKISDFSSVLLAFLCGIAQYVALLWQRHRGRHESLWILPGFNRGAGQQRLVARYAKTADHRLRDDEELGHCRILR